MKAHIVGGGFGGLAAAAYLIRHAGVSGQDITVYKASDQLGGALLLAGSAATGYILPSGALFDSEFHCTNDLLAAIPSASDPAISVRDDFFAFNARHPFQDRAHIIDRDGRIVHGTAFRPKHTPPPWEAIHRLLRRGPAPPPVYQGQHHPAALLGALKTLA
jgi:oleate hydratase